MATPIQLPRTLLIYALVIPLALVLGYLLTAPLEAPSLLAVICVFFALLLPLLIRSHHTALIFFWNSQITIYFLPGQPAVWMFLALVSLSFSLLGRILNRQIRLINVPAITRILVAIALLVILTAKLRGGIGLRSLGGTSYGGKGYVFILFAIAGYFALSVTPIPRHRARTTVGLYLLSGVLAVVSHLIVFAGPSLYWLLGFFPVEVATSQVQSEMSRSGVLRLVGVSASALSLSWFLLARFGVRGLFASGHPFRLPLLMSCLVVGALGGYRSVLLLFLAVFTVQFCLEGLHRTKFLLILAAGGLFGVALLIPLASRLPIPIQRAISFLPVNLDPVARVDAAASTEWRMTMWRYLLPELPKYILLGKGYALNPTDMYFAVEAQRRGYGDNVQGALLAGDYHNGPLSVYVPFGMPGVVLFVIFVVISIRALYRNHRYGDPELQPVNTFLLAFFLGQFATFTIVFGALSTQFYIYTGVVGLSVALNGGVRPRPAGNDNMARTS